MNGVDAEVADDGPAAPFGAAGKDRAVEVVALFGRGRSGHEETRAVEVPGAFGFVKAAEGPEVAVECTTAYVSRTL